jgi:hypothetical protein
MSTDITDAVDAPLFWSAPDLEHWRATAPLGSVVAYYTGPGLMRERTRDVALDATAAVAWHLYMSGRACLTQSQISPGVFEYRATAVDLAPVRERDRAPPPTQLPSGKPRKR